MPYCRPRRSVNQSVPDDSMAFSTCLRTESASVASGRITSISLGEYCTPMRMSTVSLPPGEPNARTAAYGLGLRDRDLVPLRMVVPGVGPGHAAREHAPQRRGAGQGEQDVADHDEPGRDGGPVVHERGPRPPVQRERLVPAHDRAGHDHDRDHPGDKGRVRLLASVEL